MYVFYICLYSLFPLSLWVTFSDAASSYISASLFLSFSPRYVIIYMTLNPGRLVQNCFPAERCCLENVRSTSVRLRGKIASIYSVISPPIWSNDMYANSANIPSYLSLSLFEPVSVLAVFPPANKFYRTDNYRINGAQESPQALTTTRPMFAYQSHTYLYSPAYRYAQTYAINDSIPI